LIEIDDECKRFGMQRLTDEFAFEHWQVFKDKNKDAVDIRECM
jgi:hypothetical protein